MLLGFLPLLGLVGYIIFAERRRKKERVKYEYGITLAEFEKIYDELVKTFGEENGRKMARVWVLTMRSLGKRIDDYTPMGQRLLLEIGHGPGEYYDQMIATKCVSPELLPKCGYDTGLASRTTAERVAKLKKMQEIIDIEIGHPIQK